MSGDGSHVSVSFMKQIMSFHEVEQVEPQNDLDEWEPSQLFHRLLLQTWKSEIFVPSHLKSGMKRVHLPIFTTSWRQRAAAVSEHQLCQDTSRSCGNFYLKPECSECRLVSRMMKLWRFESNTCRFLFFYRNRKIHSHYFYTLVSHRRWSHNAPSVIFTDGFSISVLFGVIYESHIRCPVSMIDSTAPQRIDDTVAVNDTLK